MSDRRGDEDRDAEDGIDEVVGQVRRWLAEAANATTAGEHRTSRRLGDLVGDPHALAFTMAFIDRVARPDQTRVAAGQLRAIVRDQPTPRFLSPPDRAMLAVGARLARHVPDVVVPLARRRMRMIVGHLVADAHPEALGNHVRLARAEGFSLNVNLLGEAVLGEGEAAHRRSRLMALIDDPHIDYVSIKVSSVVSQINPWAFDSEVERIAHRLHPLFAHGAATGTFINLDSEEYRDLALTVAVFRRLLDHDDLAHLDAGIVLQAYLPDALGVLGELVEWSDRRHARTGAQIKIRLVKGANLAMERVEAAMHGWPLATYDTKVETDANYRRCLDWVLRPGRLDSVRIGVASHNLFDVAWADQLCRRRGVADRVEFEMLQGMAPGAARTVRDAAGSMLLYTPAVATADFDVAIGYLFRRLEENAAPGNYLREQRDLTPDGPAFARLASAFADATPNDQWPALGPRRTQDRSARPEVWPVTRPFDNEPDTDPALPANRAWAEAAIAATPTVVEVDTPMVIDKTEIDAVIRRLRWGQQTWGAMPAEERQGVLYRVADVLAARRGELLGVMVREGAKTVAEADTEISEAIDFARYYGDRALDLVAPPFTDSGRLRFDPLGVVAVVPPWNFPLAIPAGGVLAALAAGNTVVLKPAPQTPRTAALVAQCCWEAGVGHDVLAFVRTPDNDLGRHLVTSVDGVILTGSVETAQRFRSWRPDLVLFGETSGKNAMVITPSADIDLAVADLVRSAFGHGGQKCSAASLAICVGEVYESDRFRRQLVDAVRSLRIGPAEALTTSMGPVIAPVADKLRRALSTLDPGESWLVEPRQLDDCGRLWSPGVRTGVAAGSWFHHTECFGPVLGVMAAATLEEAVRLQNATAYGLTGGIHSLDPVEVAWWQEQVEVGNAYVNRPTTGAIVRRQPFGGWKQSVVGPGAKTGGPNYVHQLGHWTETGRRDGGAESEEDWLSRAEAGDAAWWTREFSREHDPSRLFCEANTFRYRPHPPMGLWIGEGATTAMVARVRSAANRCGTTLQVSGADESEEAFLARMVTRGIDRIRVVGQVSERFTAEVAANGMTAIDVPVVANGRIEMLWYLREQTVSRTLHRFGNLLGPSSATAAGQGGDGRHGGGSGGGSGSGHGTAGRVEGAGGGALGQNR